jgi:hypothetical protein
MAVRPTAADAVVFGKEPMAAGAGPPGSMVQAFTAALTGAEVDAARNAQYGGVPPERTGIGCARDPRGRARSSRQRGTGGGRRIRGCAGYRFTEAS